MTIMMFVVTSCENKQDTFEDSRKQEDSEEKQYIDESEGATEQPLTEDAQMQEKVDDWIETHSLEEKVCQLFVMTPEQLTDGDIMIETDAEFEAIYEQYPIGGFIFFGDNLESPDQVKGLLDSMQNLSQTETGLPPFLSVDEEGGKVVRIAGTESFDVENVGDMCDVGATKNPQNAADVGNAIGTYLGKLGFNLDFAPVADVWWNPENTVVERRSFGDEPDLVAEMVLAEKNAMKDTGVVPVIKHFPGHGGTAGDTHDGYAYTKSTYQEMQEMDLIPFLEAVEDGTDMIMVSHIAAPNVTGDDIPSSMSKQMVTTILRQDMGYQGIVITDAMNMGAIANDYSSSEAAVAALEAGVDIILMPEDFVEAYQGVLDAVSDGSLSEERINESVERILRLKYRI